MMNRIGLNGASQPRVLSRLSLCMLILTKDNLVKRQWTECTKCIFCGAHETIDHIFIACPFARLVSRVVHFTFNIPPPTSVNNLFGNWLNGINKQIKAWIHVGVCFLVWAIWNCRNDVVFNRNAKPIFFAGYPHSYFFDSHVVIPSPAGPAGTYRYWMQSTDGGCSGYIQPGWLVAH
jgi:hypothetical protein